MKSLICINSSAFFSAASIRAKSFQKSPRRTFAMLASSKEPRRFAPLKEGAANTSSIPRLKGVVFDVDGTLWLVLHFS